MSVKERAMEQCLRTLGALGCKYKIIAADGQEYGDLQLERRKKIRNLKYKYGLLSSHVNSFLNGMAVGDVVVIPCGEFDVPDLQSCTTSMANKKWGAGAYKTARNGQTLEVLRVA